MDKMICDGRQVKLKKQIFGLQGIDMGFFLKLSYVVKLAAVEVRGDDFTKFTETMQKGVSFKVF